MRKTQIAVVSASVAVLLAGCSSSAKQAQTLPITAGSTTPAAMQSSPTVNLQGELLTVSALPAGWSSISSPPSGNGVASCAPLNSENKNKLPEHAKADFQAGSLGPFVSEELAAGSAAQVSTKWAAFATAASECRTFTSPASSGGTDKYTLEALSFPSYGDQTYAFAVTVTTPVADASGDVVVVRKGDTVVEIITIGLTGVPVATVEQITSAAVAKVG